MTTPAPETEPTLTDDDLWTALERFWMWDYGDHAGGLHDPALRERVKADLVSMNRSTVTEEGDERARLFWARHLREKFLSEHAVLACCQSAAEMVLFIEWLGNEMGYEF